MMQVRISYFSLAFVFLLVVVSNKGCKINQTPQFVNINNVSISDLSLSAFKINSKANFVNPNDIGLTLKNVELSLFVNGKPIGSVNQVKSTKIKARSEFAIPLQINVAQANLLNAVGGLGGAFGAMFGKEFDIEYRGKIKLSKFWIPFTIPINYKTKFKM